tara:strand:- start:4001 stop:4336 length:336 start_codon:yes stop_codon:yes gene_type:complete
MARQKLFWGAIVKTVAPMVIGGLFGGGSGISAVARGGGRGGALQAFLDSSRGESDLAASQLKTQREQSRVKSKTAEELAAEAFKNDHKLNNSSRGQFATNWQPIQDTMDNG